MRIKIKTISLARCCIHLELEPFKCRGAVDGPVLEAGVSMMLIMGHETGGVRLSLIPQWVEVI